MDFEDFKNVLRTRPEDFAVKMYNYGYSCGERSMINFEDIKSAFVNFNYSEEEEMVHLHKITKGYRNGSIKEKF